MTVNDKDGRSTYFPLLSPLSDPTIFTHGSKTKTRRPNPHAPTKGKAEQNGRKSDRQHLSSLCHFLGWPTSERPDGPRRQTPSGRFWATTVLFWEDAEVDKASVSGLLLPVWQMAWGRVSLRVSEKNRIKAREPRRSGQRLVDGVSGPWGGGGVSTGSWGCPSTDTSIGYR